MSLVRLLTAGRSLIGAKEATRYKDSPRGSLPKFGPKTEAPSFKPNISTKPEASSLKLQTSEKPQASSLKAEACQVAQVPVRVEERGGDGSSPEPRASVEKMISGTSHPQPAQAQSVSSSGVKPTPQRGDWLGRFVDVLSMAFGSRPKAAKRPLPQFSKPLVQGELSLDNITVLRNDLSDSDLEVAPAKSRTTAVSPAEAGTEPAPAPQPAVQAQAAKAEPVDTAWGRVSHRLFGAGKS
jgi:hypothetical protein